MHNWWFIQNGKPAVCSKCFYSSDSTDLGCNQSQDRLLQFWASAYWLRSWLNILIETYWHLFKVSIFLCVHPVRHGDALQCGVHHPGDNLPKEHRGRDSWEVPPHGVRVCCESRQTVPVSVSQKFTLTLSGFVFHVEREAFFSKRSQYINSNFAFQGW